VVDHFVRLIARTRQPTVFTLRTAIDRFLAPIRQTKAETVEVDMPELVEIAPEVAFSEDDDANLRLLLDELPTSTLLSAALQEATRQGLPRSSQKLLVLQTLLNYGADDGSESYEVKRSGSSFEFPGFYGDDLLLEKLS